MFMLVLRYTNTYNYMLGTCDMANTKKQKVSLPALPEKYDERSKYDWNTIRNDYIYGYQDKQGTLIYPKPKDLEEKHNVPAQYISNRATKEKWLKHREAHQNEVAIAQQKEHQKRLANKAVKFDEKAAIDATLTQDVLGARMMRMMQLDAVDNNRIQELIAQIEDGRPVDRALRDELKPLVSTYEWEAIWKAYTLANEVGRKALGITDEKPTLNQTNIQVNQVSPTAALKELDELRNQKILEAMNNPNMRIPAITVAVETDEDEIEDAELIEDDDDSTGFELASATEDGGQVYSPHSPSSAADSTEPE
jgi:hypothetical protein